VAIVRTKVLDEAAHNHGELIHVMLYRLTGRTPQRRLPLGLGFGRRRVLDLAVTRGPTTILLAGIVSRDRLSLLLLSRVGLAVPTYPNALRCGRFRTCRFRW
jgi:hypothetical protein